MNLPDFLFQELFSAVGPLKNARLTRPGVAEIIYRTPEHAAAAYKKYHGRNLDGKHVFTLFYTKIFTVMLIDKVLSFSCLYHNQ